VIERALAGLDAFTIEDEQGRRLEACQSPVWDTALAVLALLDAGFDPGHEAVARGALWLAGREVRVRGDWSVRRPDLEPGGFPFEFANDNYPDVDDTAVVVLALRRVGIADGGAAERGVAWSLGMQSSDGGWAAFDVDNTSGLPAKLPFCDFGAVTDPPSADVTAHMVEMLAYEGRTDERATQRGIEWLLRRAGAGWIVVRSLGREPRLRHRRRPSRSRAVRTRRSSQRERSRRLARARAERRRWLRRRPTFLSRSRLARARRIGPRPRPHGRCSASTLQAPTKVRPPSGRVNWLVETQRSDGSWDEPYFTGTGFPGDFYINYHLYRQVFPVMALGRALGSRG
jgi:squalene-hopene/tetraprenyl-beta-curcumene cyclase